MISRSSLHHGLPSCYRSAASLYLLLSILPVMPRRPIHSIPHISADLASCPALPPAGAFFCNWFSMLLTMLVAQSVGLLLGATVMNPKTALALATIFMLCVMLVGECCGALWLVGARRSGLLVGSAVAHAYETWIGARADSVHSESMLPNSALTYRIQYHNPKINGLRTLCLQCSSPWA